jgi:hypothetical protein
MEVCNVCEKHHGTVAIPTQPSFERGTNEAPFKILGRSRRLLHRFPGDNLETPGLSCRAGGDETISVLFSKAYF